MSATFYCQGCGRSVERTLIGPVFECECGGWWAGYAPSKRKMQLVRELVDSRAPAPSSLAGRGADGEAGT